MRKSTTRNDYSCNLPVPGLMLTGNEISQILLSLILSYHGAHRNRPRWIAWGVAFSALSCFVVALPHFIYGPGSDALTLTKEFGLYVKNVSNSTKDNLCGSRAEETCELQETAGDFSIVPLVLVFLSQFILGIGNTLYFSLGQTYLDDNTKKTETPVLLGKLNCNSIPAPFTIHLNRPIANITFYH